MSGRGAQRRRRRDPGGPRAIFCSDRLTPRQHIFVSLAAARGGRTVATAADAAAVVVAALDLKWHYHDCIAFDIA